MVDEVTSFVTTATSSASPLNYIGASQCDHVKIEWKWGGIAALAMALLALFPQLHLITARGRSWSGNYAHSYRDESAYSAYLQALINGHSRRNDPYTGREDQPEAPLHETLFSIQFIPAYLAAIPARLLGLSASSIFIALMPIIALSSSLVLYWLLATVTQNSRLAAAGVLVVLCLSTLVSLHGPVRMFFGQPGWTYLPFLRRYLPSIPFPFFLSLLALVWRITAAEKKVNLVFSVFVCAILIFLNFSYFYLWTAALAWLICVVALWLIARPKGWQHSVRVITLGIALSIPAVVTYVVMLTQRARTADTIQVLLHTRAPDLLRPSEVLSAVLLAVIGLLIILHRLPFKDYRVLFAISLLLLPISVFNQQILTGSSLQPFHYEEFVTSYCVLLALVIVWSTLSQYRILPSALSSYKALFWIAVVSFAYGANTAATASGALLDDNLRRDKTVAMGVRLREMGRANLGIVLPTDLWQGDMLPSVAPQPVLWAIHMPVFAGNHAAEEKERFYQFLYYSGVSARQLDELLTSRSYILIAELFGPGRTAEHLTQDFHPVSASEIGDEVKAYADYLEFFNRETAAKYQLSYVIIPSDAAFDVSNLDQWYERDAGELIDGFIIYHVNLRP